MENPGSVEEISDVSEIASFIYQCKSQKITDFNQEYGGQDVDWTFSLILSLFEG